MHKLQVGQQLWHTPVVGRSGYATGTKVGRKWADISTGQRVDLATLIIEVGDSGTYRGRCYLTREDWAIEVYRQGLYRGLSRRLRDRPAPKEGVTVHNIQEAARLLGIDLSDISPPMEQGVTDAG